MDPIGGISPNPNQNPGPDPMQSPSEMPQTNTSPSTAPTPVQPVVDSGFASVPMTDPNAPGPMVAPQEDLSDPMATLMDSQPVPPPPPKKGHSGIGKKIALVVVVLLLIASSGAGGYFYGYTTGKSAGKQASDAEYQQQQAAQQKDTASTDTKSTTTAPKDMDLGDLKDPETYSDESLDGALGETIKGGDGFVMRVNNIERNFTTDDANYTADDKKELVKVNFQVGNSQKSKKMDFTADRFSLLDSTGASIVPASIESYENKLGTTTLDPGSQANVSLVFEVTKADTPLQLVRSQQYRISNQDKVVTYKITITVTK